MIIRAPEIINDLELDPEGDGLFIGSRSREALIAVACLVAAAKRDPQLINEAIRHAERDEQME